MGTFKTDRMTDSTIGSTIDNQIGLLETDIAEAFGLSLGVSFSGRQSAKVDSSGYLTDSVKWSTSPSNGVGYGWRSTGMLGETTAFGDVLYLKSSDSRWYKAKADTAATAGPVEIAMALETGGSGDTKALLHQGFACNTSWGWGTVGAPLYISGATAGAMSQTAPSTTDYVVRIVGYARTSSIIMFNPDRSWVELV